MRRYDRLPGKSAIKEFAISVIAPFMTVLGLGKKLIHGTKTDYGEYTRHDSELHEAVLGRVRDTIADALNRYYRVAIVSHGIGAVVTYDALWQLSHDPEYSGQCDDLKVDIWVMSQQVVAHGRVT